MERESEVNWPKFLGAPQLKIIWHSAGLPEANNGTSKNNGCKCQTNESYKENTEQTKERQRQTDRQTERERERERESGDGRVRKGFGLSQLI